MQIFCILFFIKMFLINIKWPSFTIWGVRPHLLQYWLTKVKRAEGIMLRTMLTSMFHFRYIYIYIYIIIYIYIYVYIYINIYIYGNQTLIFHHGCSCYYYYYLYNCNWSFLHAFVVMCYLPKLKRGMASFFWTNFNIRPNFLINI